MPDILPNRQFKSIGAFAYLAMDAIASLQDSCHMGKILPNRIREWREKRGLTLEQLSELAKVSAGYLQRMEVGERNVSLKNLAQISAALNVDQKDLVDSKRLKSPIVGYVGAGAETHLFAEGQGPFGFVDAPDGATEKTVAVEIRGESLGALFDQWLVFYDDVHDPPTSSMLHKLCVVGLSDGRVLVKKLELGQLEGRHNLISNTEPPIYDVEIKWAAKVRQMAPR